MAKRYVDETMWDDPWFTSLNPIYKLIWKYICDTCYRWGVWKVNLGKMMYLIRGYGGGGRAKDPTTEEIIEILNSNKERVRVINEETWFIVEYINFQWKAPALHPDTNKMHRKFKEELDRLGIEYPVVTSQGKLGVPSPNEEVPAAPQVMEFAWDWTNHVFTGNVDEMFSVWKEKYPQLDMEEQRKLMEAWLISNEDGVNVQDMITKGKPGVWKRFGAKWLFTEVSKAKAPAKAPKESPSRPQEKSFSPSDRQNPAVDEANKAFAAYRKKKGATGNE